MSDKNLYYSLHRCHCDATANLERHLGWRKTRGLTATPKGDTRWRVLSDRVRLTAELLENLEHDVTPSLHHIL